LNQAYQGAVNAAKFDGPTRALNASLSGAGAIVGAIMIGYLVLDGSLLKRRSRGYLGLGVVTVLTIIIWACGLPWQLTFTRADTKADAAAGNFINYKEAAYRGKGPLFFFCTWFVYSDSITYAESRRDPPDYFGDACYQALAYWIMSALTNDPFKLARFAGFYKAIQSAVSLRIDIILHLMYTALYRAQLVVSVWMRMRRRT